MELVVNTENGLVTSSRMVAEHFGKRHDDVLKAIDAKKGTPQNCGLLDSMFFETTYTTTQNKQVREVLMNRDGFSLLAMGFTGPKALEFQLEFINEFNRMEQELKKQIQVPTSYAQALLEAGRLALELEQEIGKVKALSDDIQVLEHRIAEHEPKLTYLDTILQSNEAVTITQIAADYGISATALNSILSEAKVQRKVNKQWILYTKYMNHGFTKSQTITVPRNDGTLKQIMNTNWTQKGRLFIHELLSELGYIAKFDAKLELGA